jgi:WhiB family transcriptional regulator, redox-sensing transcriptional regulator
VDLSWNAEAACRGLSPGIFYPDDVGEHYDDLTMALVLCEGCKVRDECLDHALQYEGDGIWAGTTPRERRVMRKELGITLTEPQMLQKLAPRGEGWHGTANGWKKHNRRVREGAEIGPITCQPCILAYREYARRVNQAKKRNLR